MDAFEHHGVGADHDAVLDNHGCGACRLDNAREYGARANVAVLAHRGAAAQDGTHVDHGSIADDSADIDDGAHHDDGVVADGDAIANDRAGLDARVDALGVEQGHGGVAAVVLDLVVIDGVGVVLQDAGQLAPVTEDDLALAATEDMRALPVNSLTGLFANIQLHRRLLLRAADEIDDFLGVHLGVVHGVPLFARICTGLSAWSMASPAGWFGLREGACREISRT